MHNPEHIFQEKARIERLSKIREIVFGAQDGLMVPLGVVSSVAGAFANNHIVIIAGIAEALAGAFSMATGAYLSSRAEREVHVAEIEKEKLAIKEYPEDEKKEIVMMFQKEGLSQSDAELVAGKLAMSEKSFLNTMIQKELGLEPEPAGAPLNDAIYVGISYLAASLIPIVPYFFVFAASAVVYSIATTLIALFAIGIVKARFTGGSWIKSGVEVLIIGSLAGIGGYLLGTVLPTLLGVR